MLSSFSITGPSQFINAKSFLSAPQNKNNLKNYSNTILALESAFIITQFPQNKALKNYNTEISKGKLKGQIIHTGP